MKQLQTQIRKNGYTYDQFKRGESAFLYSQRGESGTPIAFEVFKRKEHKPYTIGGVDIEGGESFPSDEAFGKWAWTYPRIDQALAKFEELENANDIRRA